MCCVCQVGYTGIIVIFEFHSLLLRHAVMSAVTASSGTKGIEFGMVEIGLGFDERATVVTHWLVTVVGILRH